jgi:gluconate 2-dehydrogenase gamma chain
VTAALGSDASAVLVAVLDRLIPDDEHGPGALAAGVPRYLEGVLERAGDTAVERWEAGLAAIGALARGREGGDFAALPPELQDRVLELAAEGHEAAFFTELRQRAIEGMFCDPSWGGNAGEVGWRLLGYAGPRHVWTAADQRIGEAQPAP